jgi:signal transduction histidine kinase
VSDEVAADLTAAVELGRIAALAAGGQRDLQERATAYPELFPSRPFDATVFSAVSQSTAFGAPWCTREQLRIANRTALWIFALDWRIDHLSRSRAEVDEIVRRCLAVVDGAEPVADDPLGAFLAEIRDELAATPAFEQWSAAWRAEFARMLGAMTRERQWTFDRDAGVADWSPSLDDYLENADNFGSSFVNVSHWIAMGEPKTLDRLAELTAAGRTVQRILRLVNDLATYARDVQWGDLNALMLVAEKDVTDHLANLVEECRLLLRPLSQVCPREARYLARQIGFSTGFYQLADFWGRL